MENAHSTPEPVDLFIIGGGINGCGIARDAAGRGLSVTLAEMGDLASATSSWSTKLFHGGLRYLEFFEFRLVREALIEREVLLRAMPHISWPMRFVLPYHRDIRFDSETPTSRLLSFVMPWMKGRRPAWLIRLGLFLYDHLGGRKILPGTRNIDLKTDPVGAPLNDRFEKAFEYSDCWVEDSRLVMLNARDAQSRGAKIMTQTKVVATERSADNWVVTTEDQATGARQTHAAKFLVNAAGPWVGELIQSTIRLNSNENVRLVRGSHIVTRRLFDHDKCYFFQGTDGRIIFAIPYETDFTLIGTTDAEHTDPGTKPECTDEERDYLLTFASNYLKQPVTADDIVWTYSGVRPLYDDGASSATAATRDYVLKVDTNGGAPLLNIFGGKITTYRRLAEAALAKIGAHFPELPGDWTAGKPLPGGDFPVDAVENLIADLIAQYPFLTPSWAKRLVKAYGTEAKVILGDAKTLGDLGQSFGATITARELDWAVDREWVRTAADFLWRRTKLGLRLSTEDVAAIEGYISSRLNKTDEKVAEPA
ncbi:MAG: glycerol-3-phosphate dehydrogenase [Pseudomonadota bacterium]